MKEEILLRYIKGDANSVELQSVADWISENESNRDKLFEMERLWRMKEELRYSQKKRLDKSYNNFAQKHFDIETSYESNKRIQLPQWLMYAASIILISLLSIGTYQFATTSEPSYTNIETPRGQRTKLTLNDGSIVWLNSDSKLTYSNQFGKDIRQVKLEGEAFFEVAKDTKHPFVVNSKDLDITVLGTKFNVKAYNEDIAATVSLRSGKVQVENKDKTQKMNLLPNQELVYEAGSMKIQEDRNADLFSSWLSGELHFDDEPLANIIKTLERQFDVTIILSDLSLGETRFTCRARHNASLTDVLELLKTTRKISYKQENSKIIIS